MRPLNRFKNSAYPWHVYRDDHNKLRIGAQPRGLLEYSAQTYGECQKYLYAAERRERDARMIGACIVYAAGVIAAVWLLVQLVRAA